MIVEMGCLILGVPVGFLLRRKPLVIKIMNRHVGRYAVSRTAKDEGAAQ